MNTFLPYLLSWKFITVSKVPQLINVNPVLFFTSQSFKVHSSIISYLLLFLPIDLILTLPQTTFCMLFSFLLFELQALQ